MRLRDKLQKARAEIPGISVDDARRSLEKGDALFVDVRETVELNEGGTIPGAMHASRGFLELYLDPQSPSYRQNFEMNAGKPIIVFCASGTRSLLAAATMREMGLENLRNLEGGFNAWRTAGGPVEQLAK